MPGNKYLKLFVDNEQLDINNPEELPFSISYKREDPENFQSKRSSEAFNIQVPATILNDRIANTFHNPGIEDLTPEQVYRSFRPALAEVNGYELLIGKALLNKARHNSLPLDYEFDFYGNNADWLLPLKEVTLFDLAKHITFPFTKEHIMASWAFDGTDQALPYVFAPVRYGQPLEKSTITGDLDSNMVPAYMKPSMSKYWFLYWGFKSIGYKIQSTFLDTEYFRRQVMPWTWGNFLFSDGTRLDNLGFLAKSDPLEPDVIWNTSYHGYYMVNVGNDFTDGAYDNNGVYNADPGSMFWEYKTDFNYGTLDATFHFQAQIDATATANSHVRLYLQWWKNGVMQGAEDTIVNIEAPTIGRRDFFEIVDVWRTIQVDPGDIVELKIRANLFDSGLGRAHVSLLVTEYKLDYFRIPLGGTIDFQNFNGLKKFKFIDLLAGILDEFNISPGTDPINKVVVLEPEHDYSLTDDLGTKAGGYLNGNHLNWNDKQDISKVSELHLVSDSDRELYWQYKDDSNDGMQKKVQDRNSTKVSVAKFVLPDRFKTGRKEIENRFFSAAIHCHMQQWTFIDDAPVAFGPYIVTLIPENISNTSREEAQNTFIPKSCYYKGMQSEVSWIFDDEVLTEWPLMFAVNYQPGGHLDPILSYGDEFIGLEGEEVIGKGLLNRFFLQRMANTRNGQTYDTHFKLNNNDVSNVLHREFIECRGQKFELAEIKDYKPLLEQTTGVLLRKWAPITQADSESIYPSADSVAAVPVLTDPFDIKYAKSKCLSSDIPVIQPYP